LEYVEERLAERVALVTGASRGIGRAVAVAFAAAGARVCASGRNVSNLEATVRSIEEAGGTARAYPCDVRDDAAVRTMVDSATADCGPIRILVNNAGIDDDTPFLEVDRARWREVIDTNLTAAFIVAQEVARRMASSGGGVILHTASIDAHGADGPYVAYNASKAGLLGLSRTMAMELARYGIRSNCVSPGFTRTEMTEHAVGPDLVQYLDGSFDRVPMRRLVKTEEVANAFVFLASDEASAITGAELRVDAGLTANLYILETLPKAQ
jgi:meso-butanediol dehydrogenase / (S,S)-butanediol dehydrogenase / diacetyl reductase